MTKLSIIVPIYGVEQYLRKCVDSLLNQDLDNYEIILVDDGGTDGCPQICDEYAERAKSEELRGKSVSIRVVHRENGGLSAARNSGIGIAGGEYIMFVDSDDYIEPNVLGGLLAQIEREELDVLRYDFQNVRVVDARHLDAARLESSTLDATHLKYEVFSPNKAQKRDVDLSEIVVDGETFLNERLGPGCYAWQFVIKRELLNNCMFKEGIYFEDTEWTPRMLLRAKRVASTQAVAYNYLWREGSITLPDNPQKRDKVLRDKIALIKGLKEQQKLVNDKSWFVWMTSFTAMSILGMLAYLPSEDRKPYLMKLKSLGILPLSIKREKVLSHKIKIILANISPLLYYRIMGLRFK